MDVSGVAAVRAGWMCSAVGVSVAVGMVEAVISIVGGAFMGVGEDGVGGGDFGESLTGVGIVTVAVWVVAEGEGVEFSGS